MRNYVENLKITIKIRQIKKRIELSLSLLLKKFNDNNFLSKSQRLIV